MPDTQDHRHGAGRLLTGTAWLVLLLGAWLWSGGGGQR
ncbi:class F sortase, partial [Streptomyces sp. SID9944]|nr:class F sortase [Streptomyces sp. SID9944]